METEGTLTHPRQSRQTGRTCCTLDRSNGPSAPCSCTGSWTRRSSQCGRSCGRGPAPSAGNATPDSADWSSASPWQCRRLPRLPASGTLFNHKTGTQLNSMEHNNARESLKKIPYTLSLRINNDEINPLIIYHSYGLKFDSRITDTFTICLITFSYYSLGLFIFWPSSILWLVTLVLRIFPCTFISIQLASSNTET